MPSLPMPSDSAEWLTVSSRYDPKRAVSNYINGNMFESNWQQSLEFWAMFYV